MCALQRGFRLSRSLQRCPLRFCLSTAATPTTVQIRVIVERLVRRCGYEAVAAACPPGDAKLMSHIRKQASRKERRKAMGSEGGSQVRRGVECGLTCAAGTSALV